MSEAAERRGPSIGEVTADQDLEFAYRVAEAIKRVVEEQTALRRQVNTQNEELIAQRFRNAELWRHFVLVKESYRRIIQEFSTQLQHADQAIDAVLPMEFNGSAPKPVEPSNRENTPL